MYTNKWKNGHKRNDFLARKCIAGGFLANNLYTGPVDRVACVIGVFSRLLMFI